MSVEDETVELRRALVGLINAVPGNRSELEAEYGKVWERVEMEKEFEVIQFLAPFVLVKRRSDGAKGTLEFTHYPRFYYDFHPEVGL
jgi:hypothetical protein